MNLLGRAIRAPLALVPNGICVPVLSGGLRGAKWLVGSSTHGCWLGTYETGTQRALSEMISPGMTVFDVGANVGFFSLLASRLVGISGRVVAFEPLPRNIALLRRHVEMNNAGNITVVPVALSNVPGRVQFVDAGPSQGRIGDGTMTVDASTLDAESAEHGAPDVIKMDIEGGEMLALVGAARTLASGPRLFLSTHGTARLEACSTILRARGYIVTRYGASQSPGLQDVIAHQR